MFFLLYHCFFKIINDMNNYRNDFLKKRRVFLGLLRYFLFNMFKQKIGFDY